MKLILVLMLFRLSYILGDRGVRKREMSCFDSYHFVKNAEASSSVM